MAATYAFWYQMLMVTPEIQALAPKSVLRSIPIVITHGAITALVQHLVPIQVTQVSASAVNTSELNPVNVKLNVARWMRPFVNAQF